jgi:hypothetical protein
MVKVGTFLILASVLALLGYGAYSVFRLLLAEGVALIVWLAVPTALGGVALLVLAVVRDRLRERRREHFEEVGH